MTARRVFFLLFVVLSPFPVFAADTAGQFAAKQDCEAYVSFRKQTNPDDASVRVGESYRLLETNQRDGGWVRVVVNNAQPKERWVKADCGEGQAALCTTAGLADSYKLALSWHPAFCELQSQKKECRGVDDNAFQARNFTLHGLWPNKAACGIDYGFCGEVNKKPKVFCDYPELTMSEEVRAQLNGVMPSAAQGTCLQHHEWYKHGTCQTQWDVDEYYATAVRLTQQFNDSGVATWMQARLGKTVESDEFFAQVDQALGANAHKRLNLTCKRGNLVDVYINLPATIDEKSSLASLVNSANEDFRNDCGGRFRIDRPGSGR